MKRFNLIIFMLWTWLAGFSQPAQTFRWGIKAGGAGEDKVAGITSLGDNFYIAGQFDNRFSSGNQTDQGNTQGIYIARLDDKGNTDWVRIISGDPSNSATRISSSSENILVGGLSQGTINAEKSVFNGDGKSLFISSWNDKGKIQWLCQYPFKGYATLDVLENTKQGTILTGGMFQGEINPGSFEQSSIADKRAYLLMVSDQGKPLHLWVSEGKGSHRLVSVTTAEDGNRYLLFSITGDFGFGGIAAKETPRQMENGLALVKTRETGEAEWISYLPGTGFVEGIKVLTMPSGEPLVCANYTDKVIITDTIKGTNGYMSAALWLFSADGRLKKSHTLSSPVAVRALDAMFTLNGNILVTGYFRQEYASPQINVKSKLSFGDLFLLETDAQLAQVWHDEPAEEAFSYGKAFTLDRMGNIVLAGAFKGKLDFAGQRLESAGESDILVARYYNCQQKKASITGNTMLCEGGKTTLTVSGDYNTYLWNGQWGSSSLTIDKPGIYSVMAYDMTGCAAADTVEVKAMQENNLELPESITISSNQPVLLSATEGFIQYNWSDGQTGPQREVDYCQKCDSMYLSLTAVSQDGCQARDSVKVVFNHPTTKGATLSGSNTEPLSVISVKTWPNPVVNSLHWNINQGGSYQVSLCDNKGSSIYRLDLKNYQKESTQTLDLSKLTSGIYLLNIRSGEVLFTYKILKQ